MSFVIAGTGSDLPQQVITNADLERICDDWDSERAGSTLDDWCMQRAGVGSRHRVAPGEGTSDMATRAAQWALDDARMTAEDIDVIVLATFTSDYRLPGTVSLVQRNLGSRAKCFQLEAACAGFLDATATAVALMRTMGYRRALVVATEAMSAVVDPQRFMHQSIFGDGAGAVVLVDEPDPRYGLKGLTTHTDATTCHWTFVPGGGTKQPVTEQMLRERSQYLQLDYRSVFAFAVDKMTEATHEVLALNDATVDDIDWLIPHQTGANIIGRVAEELKLEPDKVVMCLDHTGNTSGATIPIALDEWRRAGRLADGDRVVMPTVGAGMSWGALDVVWRDPDAHGRR